MSKKPSDEKPNKKKNVQKPKASGNNSSAGNKNQKGGSPPNKSGTAAKNKKQPQKNTPKKSVQTQKNPNAVAIKNQSSGEKIQFTRDNGKKRRKTPMDQEEIDRSAQKILEKQPAKTDSETETIQDLEPPKEPLSPVARKIKTLLLYSFIIFLVVAICIALSLTVFFKIDEIEVEGETRYSADDIIAACCIQKGDNLFLSRTSEGESKIVNDFPYIETVKIDKVPFNKISINVEETEPSSIVECNGKYVTLSAKGKILQIDDSKKFDVPIILGAKLRNMRLSAQIEYTDPDVEGYVSEIISSLEENGIKDITTVDISTLTYIYLQRKDGFKIILGDPENIDYKIRTAKAILAKNPNNSTSEAIDVSLASANGGKSYLIPKTTEASNQESSKESSKKPEKETSKSSESSQSSAEESSGTTEENSDGGQESVPEESNGGSEEYQNDDDSDYNYEPDSDDSTDDDYTYEPDYDDNDNNDNDDNDDWDYNDEPDDDYNWNYNDEPDDDYTYEPDYDYTYDDDYTYEPEYNDDYNYDYNDYDYDYNDEGYDYEE